MDHIIRAGQENRRTGQSEWVNYCGVVTSSQVGVFPPDAMDLKRQYPETPEICSKCWSAWISEGAQA